MRLKIHHAPYIANQIAGDLGRCSSVTISCTLQSLARLAQELIVEDMKIEMDIESRVRDLLEQNQDEIDFVQANEKQLFGMIKRQVASDMGFMLAHEDRYSSLSHHIMEEMILEGFIRCNVSEQIVKNVIFGSFEEYFKYHDLARNVVLDKIKNHRRKLVPGSDEYELIFLRLFKEEMIKKGLV